MYPKQKSNYPARQDEEEIKEFKIIPVAGGQCVEWLHPKGTLRENLPSGVQYKLHRNTSNDKAGNLCVGNNAFFTYYTIGRTMMCSHFLFNTHQGDNLYLLSKSLYSILIRRFFSILQESKHYGEIFAAPVEGQHGKSIWMTKLFQRSLKAQTSDPERHTLPKAENLGIMTDAELKEKLISEKTSALRARLQAEMELKKATRLAERKAEKDAEQKKKEEQEAEEDRRQKAAELLQNQAAREAEQQAKAREDAEKAAEVEMANVEAALRAELEAQLEREMQEDSHMTDLAEPAPVAVAEAMDVEEEGNANPPSTTSPEAAAGESEAEVSEAGKPQDVTIPP